MLSLFRRVLEIGCGTGLLLSRIAPSCEKYFGTDISKEAIAYLKRAMDNPEYHIPGVSVMVR